MAEYQPQKIDEKAMQNMGFWSLDDMATRMARDSCLLAEQQPCSKLPNVRACVDHGMSCYRGQSILIISCVVVFVDD